MSCIIYLGLAVLVIAGSVAGSTQSWGDYRAESDVAQKINKFTTAFCNNVFKEHHGVSRNESLVFSPLSVYLTLSELANAAEGSTKRQLNSVLGGENTERQNLGLAILMNKMMNSDKHDFNLVNKFIIDQTVAIKETYNQNKKSVSPVQTKSVNFSDPDVVESMNKMIEQESRGLLANVFSKRTHFNSSTKMVVFSGAYFIGRWEIPFKLGPMMPFYSLTGETVNIQSALFTGNMHIGFNEELNAQFIKLGYANDVVYNTEKYVMIIMPMNPTDFFKFSEKISLIDIHEMYTPHYLRMNLITPRAPRIDSTLCLERTFRNMGMEAMWNKNVANLTRMTDDPEIFTKKFIHHAAMDYDNHGKHTPEASDPDPSAITFYIDRPAIVISVVNGVITFITRFVS